MLRSLVRSALFCAAFTSLTVSSLTPRLSAQGVAEKPALVVTIAPLDRTLKDISYIMRAAGAAEVSGMMSAAVNVYTSGLDRSKPAGIAVRLDENQNPIPVAFLPVSDLESFFEPLKLFGEIDNLGEGMYAMSVGPQSVFAKSKGGWLYVAQQEEFLKDVVADPMTLIGKMAERYDLSVRVDVQSIPKNLKDMILGQMKDGFEQSLQEQAKRQSPEERAAAEALGRQQIEQMEQMIVETKEALFGWAVDQSEKKTMIDFGAQFVAGSNLEKQVAGLQSLKTQFAGFQLAEAPSNLRFTSVVTPEDAQRMLPAINSAWDSAINQMKEAGSSEKDIELAKEFLKPLREVAEATLKEGIVDGGAILTVYGGLHVVAGGRIADGNKLASSLKQAYSKIPSGKPSEPKITFDASKYKNVTFHTGSAPLPPNANDEAKKVFGDQVKFIIGTADKAIYVAVGAECESRLKAFLDKNEGSKLDKTTPMELHTDMAPIMAYVNTIQSNPMLQMMTEKLQEFSSIDSVGVSTMIIPNGMIYRTTIEEGVLRAAGSAAKAGNNGGNRGGF